MRNEVLERLWEVWGTPGWRAEWDGVRGGGRLSQRFWEYFWVIDRADFKDDSVVLDVGSGSTLFLPKLLAGFVKEVIAYDPESPDALIEKVTVIKEDFGPENILRRPYTHVLCVSVFEHVDNPDKPELLKALDSIDAPLFISFELGVHRWFQQQITMPVLHEMMQYFERHYLTAVETCPVWCENSHPQHIDVGENKAVNVFPLWQPLCLRLDMGTSR